MNRIFRACWVTICLGGVLLSLASCSSFDKEEKVLVWDTVALETTIPLLDGQAEPNLSVSLSYIFPSNNDSLCRLINKIMFADSLSQYPPQEAARRFVAMLGKDYKETNMGFSENEPTPYLLDFTFSLYNDIDYEDQDILAFEMQKVTYEGGVRPENDIQHFNIDLKGKRQIVESDLFVEGYKEKLAEIIVRQLVEQFEVEDSRDLADVGFINPEEIAPNNNFYIDNEGITYCFNEYEAIAYDRGPISVVIPYALLMPILKDNAIVRKFVE